MTSVTKTINSVLLKAFSLLGRKGLAASVLVVAVVVTALLLFGSGNDTKQEVALTSNRSNTSKTTATVKGAETTEQTPEPTPSSTPTTPATAKPQAASAAPKPAATKQPVPAPAPPLASFTTKITRNSQVPAGTLISYSAAKGEKAYYGGDLLLSTPAVTISKTGAYRVPITVTVPDGAEVNMPSKPWDDNSPYFGIGMYAADHKSTGTSFNMVVDVYNMPAVGTYTLHISTPRTGQAADAWWYHSFITVVITP